MRHDRSGDRCPGDVGGSAGGAGGGRRTGARVEPRPRLGEFPGGVEVARADLADPASWPAALAGVRKVFLYAHPEGAPEFAAAARKVAAGSVMPANTAAAMLGPPSDS
jgi:uncharacterized protein YbjT (DUF2867 family)